MIMLLSLHALASDLSLYIVTLLAASLLALILFYGRRLASQREELAADLRACRNGQEQREENEPAEQRTFNDPQDDDIDGLNLGFPRPHPESAALEAAEDGDAERQIGENDLSDSDSDLDMEALGAREVLQNIRKKILPRRPPEPSEAVKRQQDGFVEECREYTTMACKDGVESSELLPWLTKLADLFGRIESTLGHDRPASLNATIRCCNVICEGETLSKLHDWKADTMLEPEAQRIIEAVAPIIWAI
uniref:Uncharacterized protein n=1 Tax=Chromera velia CCMP2878 TaxID=1169474 RepID=A0A0G4HIY8_9ALVE|eukprot:Cvel_27965.t1-p1 / transcript=Cvel_27965.t1 / gene=Cvel_27965 / organism=Chromera_velia_CCMP2878 / gene_product=hypothetical protein / transcript_product=hypothetical protein / location=Cvel_scaffold3573:1203-3465(-) / protein_length=248 / sequence_SO=supercontig / SO=protein_coding / is_pseudo=false